MELVAANSSASGASSGSDNTSCSSSNLFSLFSDSEFRLEGNSPIVEIIHQADSESTGSVTALGSSFSPGLCYYRGLFFKYHRLVVNPDLEPAILEQYQQTISKTTLKARLLANAPASPLSTRTSDVLERLTGLLLQVGLLTLQHLHEIIVAGSFYPPAAAPVVAAPTSPSLPLEAVTGAETTTSTNASANTSTSSKPPYKPRPELIESVERLLTIEALPLERRVAELVKLSDREWARYLMIAKARSRALLNVLIESPDLIGDTRVRYSYMVRLQFTQPSYLMTAYSYRGILLEKQAWSELEAEVTA